MGNRHLTNFERPPKGSTEAQLPFASYYKTLFSKTDEIQLAEDAGFHRWDNCTTDCTRVTISGICNAGLSTAEGHLGGVLHLMSS